MTEFGMSFLCRQARVGEALTKVTSPFHSVSLHHEVTPQAKLGCLQPVRGLSPETTPSLGDLEQKPESEGHSKWTRVKIWETPQLLLGLHLLSLHSLRGRSSVQ